MLSGGKSLVGGRTAQDDAVAQARGMFPRCGLKCGTMSVPRHHGRGSRCAPRDAAPRKALVALP